MTKPKIKVLSIDGGGIRGIIPCVILAEIERLTGKPASALFDLMAGTSTGGIIACMLNISDPANPAKPKFSADDIGRMYERYGSKIFLKKAGILTKVAGFFEESYTQEGLEQVLSEYLGETELTQTRTALLVTAYDIEQRKPFYFLSRLAKLDPENENFRLRDIARSTSAAPTYFEPELVKLDQVKRLALIDGGVFANNPAMLAYTEALELMQQSKRGGKSVQKSKTLETLTAKRTWTAHTMPARNQPSEMFMLSIGTGLVRLPYKYEEAKSWGFAQWLRPCLDILSQGVSETVDYQMQYVLPPGPDGTPYYVRLSPDIPEKNSELSDVSAKNIATLKAIAAETVEKNKNWIEATCEMLS